MKHKSFKYLLICHVMLYSRQTVMFPKKLSSLSSVTLMMKMEMAGSYIPEDTESHCR